MSSRFRSLIPHTSLPTFNISANQLLDRLPGPSQLSQYMPPPLLHSRTAVMAIINLTPDSFASRPSTVESSLAEAKSHIENGAHILDLGGVSTRPGADDVSEAEETQRVVPFIQALRATDWGKDIILSVDTFRATVAEAALKAGASWINDVRAGSYNTDGAMWALARRTGAPIVLMHSRGDSKSMTSLTDYGPDPMAIIQQEMEARVQEALNYGVRRWQIVTDPGLGFAKDAETNWLVLQQLRRWTQDGALRGFPCLVAGSRKRFIGQLLESTDLSDRDVGTGVITVQAAACGAVAVRVHNTHMGVTAARVADKLHRN